MSLAYKVGGALAALVYLMMFGLYYPPPLRVDTEDLVRVGLTGHPGLSATVEGWAEPEAPSNPYYEHATVVVEMNETRVIRMATKREEVPGEETCETFRRPLRKVLTGYTEKRDGHLYGSEILYTEDQLTSDMRRRFTVDTEGRAVPYEFEREASAIRLWPAGRTECDADVIREFYPHTYCTRETTYGPRAVHVSRHSTVVARVPVYELEYGNVTECRPAVRERQEPVYATWYKFNVTYWSNLRSVVICANCTLEADAVLLHPLVERCELQVTPLLLGFLPGDPRRRLYADVDVCSGLAAARQRRIVPVVWGWSSLYGRLQSLTDALPRLVPPRGRFSAVIYYSDQK